MSTGFLAVSRHGPCGSFIENTSEPTTGDPLDGHFHCRMLLLWILVLIPPAAGAAAGSQGCALNGSSLLVDVSMDQPGGFLLGLFLESEAFSPCRGHQRKKQPVEANDFMSCSVWLVISIRSHLQSGWWTWIPAEMMPTKGSLIQNCTMSPASPLPPPGGRANRGKNLRSMRSPTLA